jgi:ribonuclease III
MSGSEPADRPAAVGDGDDRDAAVLPLLELIDELPESLREQALTHSSWTDRRFQAWGRLAFLGDSVLGLTIADALFARFPRADIGRLTKIHGQTVSGRACREVAERLGVPEWLRVRVRNDRDGGIGAEDLIASERAMASITEALIGACYLHQGLELTARAVLAAFDPQIELATGTMLDFKSALQEQLARGGRVVTYAVVAESGPPHARVFEVEARVEGEPFGEGRGPSKKAAEQAAAADALASLEP